MRPKHTPLLIALAGASLFSAISSRLAAQDAHPAPSRIQSIDESARVVLKGNRHPLALSIYDRGPASPDLPLERMLLVLKRDAESESALERFLVDQQDKSSPHYHAWLSPEQFAERFAPFAADREKLAAWLESHGFRVNRTSRGGMTMEFSGTAAQVEEAFHTSIHRFVVGGESHYANASDPQIPAALAPVVEGVASLHNFRKPSASWVLGSVQRLGNTSRWSPNFTYSNASGTYHYLAPGDFAKIYNFGPLYASGIDGTGQSIAIVARSSINLTDMQVFRLAFGLPPNDPEVIVDGPDPGNDFGADESESDLSAEWEGALAPKATIKLVVSASTDTTDGADLSALYAVDNNLAPVLSMTFGACESVLGATERAFYDNLWQQAAAEGITVVSSSGDSGAAGCDYPDFGPATQGLAVNGVASTPFDVAVGGTQFEENGADSTYWAPTNGPDQSSVLGYIPEAVWNEACTDVNQCGYLTLYASGGGASAYYTKPAWQSGPGVPADGQRDIPDVSLTAAGQHDGYLLCQNGDCLTDANGQLIAAEVAGGTSASAPAFAAIMALVNQKTQSRQGQANFVLYPLAAGQSAANCNATGSPQSSCIFNDITQGNNNVPGQTGFAAGPGYDLATGLGSLNAANLVNAWGNITFQPTTTTLQLSPTTVAHGQAVNVTVTVAPTSGTGTPTGNVALLTGGVQNVNLGALTNGSLTSPLQTLPGGSYSVTASYGGDGIFGASASNGVAVTVSPESSSTTFDTLNGGYSTQTSVNYSDFFFFRVAVAGASGQGAATGTITFSDTFNGSTTPMSPVSLNSQGKALVPETSLAVGAHVLTASYSGDPSFLPSTSAPVNVTVTQGPTQTFLFLPYGALPNTAALLQALVLPIGFGVPTGTVQFYSGSNPLGKPVPVQLEVATFTTAPLAAGSYSITAVYSGDSNFIGSTSSPATLVVGNPDFEIFANPGAVTVSSSTPGQTTLLLTYGGGFGFYGTISFACTGLPAGTTCSFQPSTVSLDGVTSATDTLTISENGSQASNRRTRQGRLWPLLYLLGGLGMACLLLLKRPRWKHLGYGYALALLVSFLVLQMDCGGGAAPTETSPPEAPVAGLSPTSLAFGQQNEGTNSAAQTVTLSNTGNALLNISNIAIGGTNAGDFTQTNSCGNLVVAGANCALSVTFKPAATGSRSASLAITDNAGGSPQTVSLSGTGVLPSPNSYIIVVTATGNSGTSTVSHSVSLAVNLQ